MKGTLPLVGNRAIEQAAIAWVVQLEAQHGRLAVDKRYDPSFPGDLLSPPRTIEVKAVGGDQRGWFLPVEVAQYDEALRNPQFYIYVVDNVRQGDQSGFRLKVLGGERLQRLLAKVKEKRYYEMPLPVAEFEAAPGIEALGTPAMGLG